jgi:hypothetical protein
MQDRTAAERMGAAALAFVSRLTWPDTIRALTAVD